MPIVINDVSLLQRYLQGVMTRADHHANEVNEIALAVAGFIIWKKDPDPIQVRGHLGGTANALWVKINGTRYAFSYNHHTGGTIDIRSGSIRSPTRHSISNQTSLADLRQIFDSL
jgi:hypothetical protein